jgi:hypothetical protein
MLLPAALADVSWLPAYTERVQSQGTIASLPPHLSLVLGLGDGTQDLAVRQAGKRSGQEVHTFNVAQTQKKPLVVLWTTSESTKVVQAFLLNSGGHLRKGRDLHRRSPPRPVPESQARNALREELQFWAGEAGAK